MSRNRLPLEILSPRETRAFTGSVHAVSRLKECLESFHVHGQYNESDVVILCDESGSTHSQYLLLQTFCDSMGLAIAAACSHSARQWDDDEQFPTIYIEPPVSAFLNSVYALQEQGEIRQGVRLIFEAVNDWLSAELYVLCDSVLESVDLGRLGSDLALSFLTITRAARDKLPHRTGYLKRSRTRIAELRGASVAEKLLRDMGT